LGKAIQQISNNYGTSLVDNPRLLSEIAEFGIIFLLFLVGLDLQPSKLKNMLGESLLTALGTTIAFFGIGFAVMLAFGFTYVEASVTGLAAAFSSTILGIKLLPTTALHHRHIGEMVVSLLLIQDMLAILAILLLNGLGADTEALVTSLAAIFGGLPVLGIIAFLGVRYALLPLLAKFDAFHEYIFLIAIGWCSAIASLAAWFGLSLEIGAFNRPVHSRELTSAARFLSRIVLLFRGRRPQPAPFRRGLATSSGTYNATYWAKAHRVCKFVESPG